MSKYYGFQIFIGGTGDTPEEAWISALETFDADFREMPKDYSEEEIDD